MDLLKVRHFLAVLLGAVSLFISGCVMTMPKPLLSSRHVQNVPDLVGRYLDERGEEVRILASDATNNNSFVAYPPNKKNSLYVTIQQLSGSQYIVQAKPEGGQGVFLSVAEISLPKITVYVFPNSGGAVMELASRNQVAVNEDGLITEYKSAQGIITFFQSLFSINDKEPLVFTKQAR
ncbi:MAG: hypothetical protein LBP22_02625 [Deltaproteobacteria bacterium]|jgi:hypothetical protein|nr:hypothetical protein [Deltaproteobacteria bacterium]